MARDARRLDQNPVVIDPANVDAVLHDRPTPVSDPSAPPLDEVHDDNPPRKKGPGSGAKLGPKVRNMVDGSREGTPFKSGDPRR